MKIVAGVFFSLLLVSAVYALPQSAHNPGEQAGTYADMNSTVYVLSDPQLCPNGASHYYSFSNQFSIYNDAIFTCANNPNNTNIFVYPVYSANGTLLFKDAGNASGINAIMQTYNLANAQFSHKRRVIYAKASNGNDLKMYELDPWNHTYRAYADILNGINGTVTMANGSKISVSKFSVFYVGPNDEIVAELMCLTAGNPNCPGNYTVVGIGTYDPSTGQYSSYSIYNDGKGNDAPGYIVSGDFDETNIANDGRVFSTYNRRPAWSFKIDFSDPVQFRYPAPTCFYGCGGSTVYWSAHGHMGYFTGSNGKSYVVRPLNDIIDNNNDGVIDAVGQIGTAINGAWRPYHILSNTATGMVELVWGNMSYENRWGMDHFSKSDKQDVFFGDNATVVTRYNVIYNSTGAPIDVAGRNIANPNSNQSCSYWAQPRSASGPDGDRVMFDSTTAGGCKQQVYMAIVTAVLGSDTTPPVRNSGAPSGTLAVGTASTTLSLSTNEAATCRYSTTAGISYASMTNTFSTTGGTSHSTSVSVSDGNAYNYYVRCMDASGNADPDDFLISFSVASDTTAPAISISLPANGAMVSGLVTVQTAASDNAAVAYVELYKDGTLLGNDTSSPYTYSWNTAQDTNAAHTLTARAVDTSGNAATASASVFVNNTADTGGNQTFTGMVINGIVLKNASSACSACTITITINGQAGSDVTDQSGTFSIVLNSVPSQGTYILYVTIDDGTAIRNLQKKITI